MNIAQIIKYFMNIRVNLDNNQKNNINIAFSIKNTCTFQMDNKN